MDEPRLRHQLQYLVASFVVLLGGVSTVPASPLFSVGHGTGTSWAAAAGNIRVAGTGIAANAPLVANPDVLDVDTAAFQFYTSGLVIGQSMGGAPISAVQAAPNVVLHPDVAVSDASFGGNSSFDSLVMDWGENPDPIGGGGMLNVAAWDYVYDADPSLAGLEIKFSLLAPPGVWDFSLELFDTKGSSIGWFGVPPNTTWNSVVIDPSNQAPQGPFSHFLAGANPNGAFDLNTVAFIRLNESSQTGINFGTFPLAPGGPSVLGPWNAWNHLSVVTPEPASLLLLAVGLLALVWLRERDPRGARRRDSAPRRLTKARPRDLPQF